MKLTAQLCQALEGTRFVYARHIVLVLRPGLYGNGRGAIQVATDGGEPYAALTVNMPDDDLEEDELFVRTGNGSDTDLSLVRALVATTKFWVSTGRSVRSGYVENYATVWKFRRCLDHNDGAGDYAVLCDECRHMVAKRYEDQIEGMLAADAVKRLERRRNDDDD